MPAGTMPHGEIHRRRLRVKRPPRTLVPPQYSSHRCLTYLAGTPATMVPSATSFVTTLPAPTIAPLPIVTPARIVAFDPMLAPLPTNMGITSQSVSDCGVPSALVARGYLSLVNITPCPINTLSWSVTPSHSNEWLEILHRRPTFTPFCISTKAPTRVSSPISQP